MDIWFFSVLNNVNEATKNILQKKKILCILEYFLRIDSQKWHYSNKEEEYLTVIPVWLFFHICLPICEKHYH